MGVQAGGAEADGTEAAEMLQWTDGSKHQSFTL